MARVTFTKIMMLISVVGLFQCSVDENQRKGTTGGSGNAQQQKQQPSFPSPYPTYPNQNPTSPLPTYNPIIPSPSTTPIANNNSDCIQGDTFQCAAERVVIEKTNAFRRQNGRPDLIANARYSFVARDWSIKQSNGACGGATICHSGFPNAREMVYQSKFGSSTSLGGENVAMFGGFGAQDPEKVATQLVQQWINSPGHRSNMLSQWGTMGAGVICTAQGECYGTQIFAVH